MTTAQHYNTRRDKIASLYHKKISEYLDKLPSGAVLLDIGSGKLGAFKLTDPNKFYKVAMDIDEKALIENVLYDEKIQADARKLPFDREVIDVVISRDCFEHISDVEEMFKELREVIKPGGILITLIPNYLYIKGFFAKTLPAKIQNMIWKKLKRRDVMPYPVFFEINTVWKWKKFSEKYNFDISEIIFFSEPLHWFVPYPPLYWLTELFHIFLKLPLLKNFSSTLFIIVKFK